MKYYHPMPILLLCIKDVLLFELEANTVHLHYQGFSFSLFPDRGFKFLWSLLSCWLLPIYCDVAIYSFQPMPVVASYSSFSAERRLALLGSSMNFPRKFQCVHQCSAGTDHMHCFCHFIKDLQSLHMSVSPKNRLFMCQFSVWCPVITLITSFKSS